MQAELTKCTFSVESKSKTDHLICWHVCGGGEEKAFLTTCQALAQILPFTKAFDNLVKFQLNIIGLNYSFVTQGTGVGQPSLLKISLMEVFFLGQGKVFQGHLVAWERVGLAVIRGIQTFIYKSVWAQMGPGKCLKPFTWLLFQVRPSHELLTLVLVDVFHWRDWFKETPNSQRLE